MVTALVHPENRKEQKKYTKDNYWLPKRRFRIVRPDGNIRWIEARATMIFYNKKKCYSLFYTDITDQMNKN